MRYQPPPGASVSHSAAASQRLGPRGSLSTALARAQPPFPPSSGRAGRWQPAIRTGGLRQFGAGSSMPPAPSQGRNMGWGEGHCQPSTCMAPGGFPPSRSCPWRPRQGAGDSAPRTRAGQQLPGASAGKSSQVGGAGGRQRQAREGSDWNPLGTTGDRDGVGEVASCSQKVQTRRLERKKGVLVP